MSTNENTRIKRKLTISTFTLGFPLYYIIKNRNEIYWGTRLMKEFYIKELVARSCFGFFIGFSLATYFYGAGPKTKEEEKEMYADKESLEYSTEKKKRFQSHYDYLPGKIREK